MQYNLCIGNNPDRQLWFDKMYRRVGECTLCVLWFDVELGCNTTSEANEKWKDELWLDVELGCSTTDRRADVCGRQLWFDVELGCNSCSERSAVDSVVVC